MKKIYALLLFTTLFFSARTQVLLNEGFETAFPPVGWTIVNDTGGSANQWTYNTNPALTDGPYDAIGTGSMIYEYDTVASANAWAITPGVNLTAGGDFKLIQKSPTAPTKPSIIK